MAFETEAYNPVTGQTYERVGREWVETTPTPAQLAAKNMSFVDSFGASLGLGIAGLGQGLLDLYTRTMAPNPIIRKAMTDELRVLSEDNAEYQAALWENRPVASFLGMAAPYAVTGLLPGAREASAARLIAGEAALGAGAEFVRQPGTFGERGRNAAVGAAGGAVGSGIFLAGQRAIGTARNAVRAARTPVRRSELSRGEFEYQTEDAPVTATITERRTPFGEEAQREYDRLASKATIPEGTPQWVRQLLERADSLGLATTLGHRVQNRDLLLAEASLASQPGLGRDFNRIKEFNAQRYNDHIAEALDVRSARNAGSFNDEMLGDAFEKNSKEFRRLQDTFPDQGVDDQFRAQLDDIEKRYTSELSFRRSNTMGRQLETMRANLAEGGDQISGRQFMTWRSDLMANAYDLRKPGNANTLAAEGHEELVRMLDNLTARNMPEGQSSQAFHDYYNARARYRLLQAVDKSGAMTEQGNVLAGRLGRYFRRNYKREYAYSGMSPRNVPTAISDVLDATKVLKTFKDVVGDSGTATRSWAQQFVNNPKEAFVKGVVGATAGRGVFNATQSRTGSRLFDAGAKLIADPSRSAARLGSAAGLAAASQQ